MATVHFIVNQTLALWSVTLIFIVFCVLISALILNTSCVVLEFVYTTNISFTLF